MRIVKIFQDTTFRIRQIKSIKRNDIERIINKFDNR